MKFGFCDIQNNQGRGKSYKPQHSALGDNLYLDLDYSGYYKNHIQQLFHYITTQVNSTFSVRLLASSEVISQVLFTSQQPKKNKIAFCHTKTIIHLSVGERGGYLPPLR